MSPTPPLWRLEREDPPPRRKSCLACATAKRRCDQRLPAAACIRCAQRKIPCEYSSTRALGPRAGRRVQAAAAAAAAAVDRELRRGGHDPTPGQAGECVDSFVEGPWGDEAVLDPWLQDGGDDDLMMPSVQPMDMSTSDWATTLEDLDLFGDEEALSRSRFSPDTAVARGPSIVPLHVPPTTSPAQQPLQLSSPRGYNVEEVSRLLEDTMSYAVDKLKYAPKQMLLELQTPWCHVSLYKDEMPPVMQGKCHPV